MRFLGLIAGIVAVAAAAAVWLMAGTPPRQGSPAASPSPATPASPVRIVSLSPAISIILRDLGRDDLIVGRDRNDMVLDPALPVCGDFSVIDYEQLLKLKPTHVLLQHGRGEIPPRLRELAGAHGWAAKAYPLLTLDEISLAVNDLNERVILALGAAQRPDTGADVQIDPAPPPLSLRLMAAWSRRGEGFAGAGRILLLESLDPPAAFGPGSFHRQILERIGGTPAITEGKPFIVMDTEEVLRIAPDGIIIFSPRPPRTPAPAAALTPDEIRERLGRLGRLDIPAIRAGRLAVIDDPLSLTPSTAMIGVADEMAAVLGRWSAR